jgi:hypothetical protein
MAAVNKSPFKRNLISGSTEALVMLGLFQAGATQAIKRGEILEFTGNTNAAFVPLDSDASITQGVAVAYDEIKSGDRAGYYKIIVPRPGDVFEFSLATAAGTTKGTALYFSDSQTFTTSGSNIQAYAVGDSHYPEQTHLADDGSGDAGTTVKTRAVVEVVLLQATSIYTIWNMDGA